MRLKTDKNKQIFDILIDCLNKKKLEFKITNESYGTKKGEIPKIDIKYPIINDTTDEAMKISVTKFWGPDQLNQIGNLSIAGHNNRDGTMFGKTKYLEINDIIKITDLNNCTVEYKIFKIYTVDPNDVSYVDSVDETAREVTLITCTKGHEERLIIKAREIK